jgi:hypothetical protein
MPSGLQIWERTSSGWVQANVDPAARNGGAGVDVAAGTVMYHKSDADPFCSTYAVALTRQSNGVWAISGRLDAPAGTCIDDLDLDAGRAIFRVHDANTEASSAVIYELSGSIWNLVATFAPTGSTVKFRAAVALRGDLALVSASARGTHVYRRSTAGWQFAGYLPSPDSYDGGQDAAEISISDQYVVQQGWSNNRRDSVVYAFRRLADQSFQHVANLVTRDGLTTPRISGARVIAPFGPDLYEFNLPANITVPAAVQDDFESGAAAAWTTMPGSQFAIVNNGQTHVYRQSSVTTDGGAIHPADFTNQHVSADIRPIAWQGSDRFVALFTRYTNAGNYYYASWRTSGLLQLRRMVNGAFTTLATYQLPMTTTWHRLGLESSGTLHNLYVDGILVASANDATHTHGRSGMRTSHLSADFDNVVVTPGPLADLASFGRVATGGNWGGYWATGGSSFTQTLPDSGDARAVSGLPREDAAVQSTVTFGTGSTTGTPWVGLIVRYVDSRNYYYVTLRANELSLRKLTNGAVTVLDNEPFTRQPGVPVHLRLEAVGDRLRVYVNDVLRLEHAGAQIAAGKVGVMTYRASASFENYWAYEP